MSTFRNPVGPQPSRVYWRRRLIVGLGLLAVVVIIILIVVRPGSETPTPAGTNASETPAAPPAGSTNPADAVACDPTKVTVEAATDASGYDAGVNPSLSFTLKSLMTVPCTLKADTDLQEFIITSGDETIWDSKDCQTDKTPATALLQPGVPFAGSKITWDRTRSAPDTCDAAREQVTAEGASYHLTVKIGDLTSANSKQFLLN
jgi:hypothetical protein